MICTQSIKNVFTYALILILSTVMQACGGGGGGSEVSEGSEGSADASTTISPSLLWDQASWNEANWE